MPHRMNWYVLHFSVSQCYCINLGNHERIGYTETGHSGRSSSLHIIADLTQPGFLRHLQFRHRINLNLYANIHTNMHVDSYTHDIVLIT